MSVTSEYERRFRGSAALFGRASQLMPSGINHDVRHISPFPVYMKRGRGARKWDVDGNEFVDYAVGHGALMLGHAHPVLTRAALEQVNDLTHASAPTPHEVRWAELVCQMVPCAERVRFVLSGTEATMLGMRIARAYTGRNVIVKLDGHFHGWHDYAMVGWLPPYDEPSSAGVPPQIMEAVRHVPRDDLGAMERALGSGDVAGVILEPDGPGGGTLPIAPGYLRGLRDLTSRFKIPLIFDEVVTGFRLAPGGAQEYFGVVPDMAILAKAVAAGMPSGAVVGQRRLMESIALRDDAEWNRSDHVRHMGTYSAHPLAAAVGIAAMEILRDGSVQDKAADLAVRLRSGLNQVIRAARVAGCAYGLRSSFRIIISDFDDLPQSNDVIDYLDTGPERLLAGTRSGLRATLQKALLIEGVDLLGGNHGWLTGAHTDKDVDQSIAAFERALGRVIREGAVRPSPKITQRSGLPAASSRG